jgi:hypothetical protein
LGLPGHLFMGWIYLESIVLLDALFDGYFISLIQHQHHRTW